MVEDGVVVEEGVVLVKRIIADDGDEEAGGLEFSVVVGVVEGGVVVDGGVAVVTLSGGVEKDGGGGETVDDVGSICETVLGVDRRRTVDGECETNDDVGGVTISVVVVVGGVVVEDGVDVVLILGVEKGGGCEAVDDGGGVCETGDGGSGGRETVENTGCVTADGVDCGGTVDNACVADDDVG